nr:ribonuclease H-like domain-containing protein [Tanacetum cinerariifolium]
MFNLVDLSGLKLTVGHPNGTLAKITHVGNLKLNNDVILFDVLVALEYTVSLLSVNRLIKDSKLNVSFDESNCYILDLKRGKVLRICSEFTGLYLFDEKYNVSSTPSKSEYFACYVSKMIGVLIKGLAGKGLGYASDKKAFKLLSLKNMNVFYSRDVKFYETIFPYKMNKSDNFEKDFVSGVTNLIFFDNFESQIASKVSSPNDDEEGSTSGRDGRLHQPDLVTDNQSGSDAMLHQPGDDIVASLPGYDELHSTTLVDETNSFEGNDGINLEVLVFQNILENQNEKVNLRMSSRTSKFLAKLNDYVLNNIVRPMLTPLPENIVLAYKETRDDNQHMHAPLQSHFNLALKLLRYLKLALGSGIDFSKDNFGIQVVAYSNSDWAKCPMTKREKVAYGLIKTVKVDTKCQVADIFTKALGSFQHNVLVKSLRMINIF